METLVKSQTSPSKQDLYENNIVVVYNREGYCKGRVKLLYRVPARCVEDNLLFVMHEDKRGVRLWSYERWAVEWVEHDYYRVGDRNVVEVVYFVAHEVF